MGPPLGEQGLIPASAAGEGMSGGGVLLSVALHVVLGGVFVFGLPTLFRPPPPKPAPIAVELVTVAPVTRATRPNPHRPRPDAKPQQALADTPAPKPVPKPIPPKPAPPPPTSQTRPPPTPKPPKIAETKPKPPPAPKPHKLAENKPEPPPARPEPKPEPPKAAKVVVPKPPKKPERLARVSAERRKPAEPEKKEHPVHRVRAERKPEEPKKRKETKYDAAKFAALLRNLAANDNAPSPDAPPQDVHEAASRASSQPNAPLGSRLTVSEIDLVIRQIERCWVIPAGAADAKNLVIEIKAVVNPDGTVERAWVVDTARYAADPLFRATADSAKRAMLNPRCSPLRLPPDKYRAWHNLDLRFNPKDVS